MKIKFLTTSVIAAMFFIAACGGKSDSDVQKAAQDNLAAQGITGVNVAVADGVATLTGEVEDITVKNRAENASRVEGVTTVDNQITARPLPQATPEAGDAVLKQRIEENLRRIGCEGATIEITQGVVTISGTVPDARYAECIKVVQESGALKPINNLQRGS
ncbi:MAG: BON domain-containing protein [Blastocatellia bacterium]|nr:BON domain-containing protein [Blastocatellia bacterium]